jgi:O-antigen/teichoic acid export membrane protein
VTSRRIVRGAVTFAAAAVLQRAAPLLLLPLFSRVLGPGEFGQIGVIVTLGAALATLVGFGLETAMFRGYVLRADDPEAARTFVNSVGAFGVLAPPALALVISGIAAPALARLFSLPADALILGCVAAATNVSATIVPLALLRAQQRLRSYLELTWIQIAVTAGLSILFVAVLRWGVLGWMAASALSAALLLARGLVALGHRWTRDLDRQGLEGAVRFGLPLVPHAAAHWGLAVSDRAILGAFLPSPVVGAYYVAYMLTLPVNLVSIALTQATQPLFAEATHSAQRRAELGRVVTFQAVAVVLVSAAVALLGPPAARVLLPAEFADAAHYIPWLAVGSCLFGLYLIPMNAVSVMAGQTTHVWIITVLAAGTNILLNLALVPRVGAMAAAVNTAVGYAILLVGLLVYSRRMSAPAIPYEPGRIALGASLIIGTALLGRWVAPPQPELALLIEGAVLIGLGAILVTVGPLRREARSAISAFRAAGHGVDQ